MSGPARISTQPLPSSGRLEAIADRPRAITIAILAMGGEGGGVLADWIVDLAEHCGYCAQATSVPGVAQRTGATVYYLELFSDAFVRARGKEPVLALMPVPGEVDIVIASELMEAGRAIQRGLVTSDRTTFIVSTHRVYSMGEKTATDDGRVDAAKLIEGCSKAAKMAVLRDFARIAVEKRSVISSVLFGALAGTGSLPFQKEQFEDAIRRGGIGVESSLAAFVAGADAAGRPDTPDVRQTAGAGPRLSKIAARVANDFPAVAHGVLTAGIVRLADYQDECYASEFLDRLAEIRDIDDKFGDGQFELLQETGRSLAVWMTYEDAIRVADLKTRRTRFDRVKQETRTGAEQLLQIREFLYPQIEEITDILPRSLGHWLMTTGWARRLLVRMTVHGRVVQTTALPGFLQLYFLAGMRKWRRGSLRFFHEQQRIAEWLARVGGLAQTHYPLALEVAEFPRVLRGYGETYTRGRRNFDAMMAILPDVLQKPDASGHARKLREAALADDTGQKLNDALRGVTA